jgi:hypothetical protein
MPKSYVASLREVAKRRAYKKRYIKELELFSERMGRMVHVETSRRDVFVKNHHVHLPQDLIPGLTSRPSNCQIRTREFDSKLPNIKEMSSRELSELCGDIADYDKQENDEKICIYNKNDSSSFSEIEQLRKDLESQKKLCKQYETRIQVLEKRLEKEETDIEENSLSSSELVLSLTREMSLTHDTHAILNRVRELQNTESKFKHMLSEILLVMQSNDNNETDDCSNQIIQFLTKMSSQNGLLRADLLHRDKEIEKMKNMLGSKLSFRDFKVDDVALFLPAKVYYDVERTVYVAFHRSCPRRFLSEECVNTMIQKCGNRAPDFILGRITKIDVRVAMSSNNDFSVPIGSTYSLLTVVEFNGDDDDE